MRQSLPSIQGQQQRTEEALTMTMPVESVQDRRPYALWDPSSALMRNIKTPWDATKMNQLLNVVANGTHKFPSQQLLPMTQTLMEMIRQSSKQKLKSLFFWARSDMGLQDKAPMRPVRQENQDQWQQRQQQQNAQEIKPLKMKILWNLMSQAGATQTSEVLLEECLQIQDEQHVPSFNSCISAVTSIGIYSPPSEKIIIALLELAMKNRVTDNERAQADSMQQQNAGNAEMEKINNKETLEQVAILAMGSLLGRGDYMVQDIEKFVQRRQEEIEMVETQFTSMNSHARLMGQKHRLHSKLDSIKNAHLQIFQRVFKDILHRLETEDQVLLMKTLRNAHVPMSLPIIERFLLPKTSLCMTPVRIAAAQALETFTHPKKPILMMLEKVVKNTMDTMSVRVQAFRSMVNLRAPVYMLVRMADNIAFEQEKQLSTYVWSVFSHMANSTFRPYRESASVFRQAISQMKPVEYGIEDSQYYSMQMDMANEVSVLKEGSYVAGPDFSHNLDISSSLDIFGTTNKAFQFTLVSEGLLGVAKSLFGDEGFLTNRKSLMDLLQRPKREAHGSKIHDKIEEIFRQLKIKERNTPPAESYVDLQVMNQVVRLYKLSSFFQNLDKNAPFVVMEMNENQIKAGVPFQFETSGIINQYHMELPTEVGFPVHLQMGLSYTAKINGTASAMVQPSIYKDLRNGMPPSKVEMEINAQPNILGALTGKMSVDGFLLQTGNWFEAMVSLKSGGNAKVNADLFKNRFTASITPFAQNNVPTMKMEIKPYVYSLAVSNKVQSDHGESPAESTNNRPLFVTMQPVAISQGAQLMQMHYKLGKKDLGYSLTLQGQYPVKALSSATTSPLLGRSNYALYVQSEMEQPLPLTADVRYFSHRRYKQEACDSWFPWQCYSTDIESPSPKLMEPKNASFEFGKVRDIPDLDSEITLHALKENIMATIGQKMPQKMSKTEWGLIAVFNGTSSTVVKALAQTWHKGQFQQSIITVHSIPIYQPGAEPFKMAIKNSAIYPGKKFSVMNLMDAAYQMKVQKKLYHTMQQKEHTVVNKYFQRLIFTSINQDNIRHLPSMDPQLMLDRIMPELIMVSKNPSVAQTRQILKTLFPITQQLAELHNRMASYDIEQTQELLKEMQKEILVQQLKIKGLIEMLGKQQKIPRSDITAAQYAVLKVTQGVLHLTAMVERGLKLNLFNNRVQFEQRQQQMQEMMNIINKLALANFGSKENIYNPEEAQNLDENDFENTIGYDQMDSSAPNNDNQPIPPQEIIPNLKALTEQQLNQIRDMYESITKGNTPTKQFFAELIENTNDNVTMLNQALKQLSLAKNRTMTTLTTQITIQQQILVHMLRVCRINSDKSNTIDNFQRYSIKVQTKELLERGYILLHQSKADMVCAPQLNLTEHQQLKSLQWMDRQLVAMQRDRMIMPNKHSPWTSNDENLKSALATMQPTLIQLKNIRDEIVIMGGRNDMPHPCLVSKLVDTATFLQQRVSLFQRTLLAQPMNQMERTWQFEKLDDDTMSFILSLTPLFDLYMTTNTTDQKPMFPRGEILISQSLMEALKIGRQQDEVLYRLEEYLDQPFPMPYEEVKQVLKNTADDSEVLLNELKESTQRLSSSMRSTSALTARAVYQHFVMALDKQMHIYEHIRGYLQKYPSLRSELNIEVSSDKSDTKKLQWQLQKLNVPWEAPSANINSGNGGNSKFAEDESIDQLSSDSYELNDQQNPYMDDMNLVGDMDMEDQQEHSQAQDVVAEIQSPQVSEQIMKKWSLDLEPLFEGIIMNTNITYGHNNYLGFQLYAQKSVDQLLWESRQFFPESRDYAVSRTVEDTIMGREEMEKNCQWTCLRMNAYNHVHMHVSADSDELPWMVKRGMKMMMLRNLAKNNDRTDILKPQTFIQPGTMQAMMDLSHLADSVDQYLMTEKETMAVQSVPTSSYMTIVNPFQNTAPVSTMMQNHFSNGLMPAKCQVHKGNVKTVDGAIFTLPMVHKPVLLAADCSKEKTFALVMQRTPQMSQMEEGVQVMDPRNTQSLKILAQQHEVMLMPRSLSVEVSVDNQVIPLRPGQPFVIYKTLKSGTKQVALVIALEEKGTIRAEYPLVGLSIRFCVDMFTVQLSSVYSKQLCGMCGNFDGQITYELEGPQEQIFSAKIDFADSYKLDERPGQQPYQNRNQYMPQ
ncbi:hypothetical protein ACOMHN_002576 [Nucella lapillus]